jgi:hypothetical protein
MSVDFATAGTRSEPRLFIAFQDVNTLDTSDIRGILEV